MDQTKFKALLDRQNEIFFDIQKLNNESIMINEELSRYGNVTNETFQHPSKRKVLESKGFEVSTQTIDGTQVFTIKNSSNTYTVLYKQSKYYTDTEYNAWYTFNPGIEDIIDFVILEYSTDQGKPVYSVITKMIFSEIAKEASKFGDGRFNLFIKGTDTKAKTSDSNFDLTDTLNNFGLIQ